MISSISELYQIQSDLRSAKFLNPHLRMYLFILETEEGKEREKETSVWETLITCLLYAPWLRMEPTTLVCALTRNRTHNLFLVCKMTLQPTEPPGQDYSADFAAKFRIFLGQFIEYFH